MKIQYLSSAKRPNKATGQPESFIHHRLIDERAETFIARAFAGGRLEVSNGADKPLNPRRDSAVIAAIESALAVHEEMT